MRKALRTNRCAGTYPSLTPTPVPMFRRDTCGRYRHTYITHDSSTNSTAGGRLCRFGILENFSYLYVTIDGRAYRTRHVQTLQPVLERCSRTDAKPDIAQRKEKEVPQERPKHRFRHHYEEPAVECGTHRNGLIR